MNEATRIHSHVDLLFSLTTRMRLGPKPTLRKLGPTLAHARTKPCLEKRQSTTNNRSSCFNSAKQKLDTWKSCKYQTGQGRGISWPAIQYIASEEANKSYQTILSSRRKDMDGLDGSQSLSRTKHAQAHTELSKTFHPKHGQNSSHQNHRGTAHRIT